MKDFSGIKFSGTFRDYQQDILDNSQKHLQDGRIHIVAAPGSGKTILGLELIKRIGKNTLVMSPSVTIRQQWGERFAESFLPKGENPEDYVSYDIKSPSLITSITYQALHAAVTNSVVEEDDCDDSFQAEARVDYSDFDLLKTVRAAGITTVCLDEAHHLKSEWQKALEKFIRALGTQITVIALTATPPYDSTPGEWNRYISLCGEIDEEIFVPQLVKQKTLCPHQDYVYFNYPTQTEGEALREYKEKADRVSEEIIKNPELKTALENCRLIKNYKANEEIIFDNITDFSALLILAQRCGIMLPQGIYSFLGQEKGLHEYGIKQAQTAFQFIIDNPQLFSEEFSEHLKNRLMQEGLIEKKRVELISNEKLNKMLISSVGKLDSMEKIANAEYHALGKDLRMLILTDYIKKDMKKLVGTSQPILSLGTVPVFETLRRSCADGVSIALLSGTLVILPNTALPVAEQIAKEENVGFSVKPLENTSHSEVVFAGSNKNKVSIITEMFSRGLINILIGTKSLLGEGWDSPSINSLILASFVGSFMLSNQMRGRAIRIDKTKPDKASNIWHLVTVEPKEATERLWGTDYETLIRRFDCFLAPAYSEDVIESGLDRVDILKPPFDENGINRINSQMLSLARDRKTMCGRWTAAVKGNKTPEIVEMNEIPAEVQPKKFFYKNVLLEVILILIILLTLIVAFAGSTGFFGKTAGVIAVAVLSVFALKTFTKIKAHSTPEKSVYALSRALLKTLKDTGDIESRAAALNVKALRKDLGFSCTLSKVSFREKKIFSDALAQMLSPIDDPRYLIIKKTELFGAVRLNYSQSYACPSVIGTNKEKVQRLAENLKKSSGKFELVYTRSETGNRELKKCKKLSYINLNGKLVKIKKAVK